jgi:pimeloyl-ACP methyl ester carboxylesterase
VGRGFGSLGGVSTPRFIELPGGRFAYRTFGADDAPLVLCLHGFPDHPASFEPLAGALANAGYRAVTPWMRGYAPSTLEGPFDLDRLAADLVELALALSPSRAAALVGHDWGAAATYAALAARPARFAAAVTMAVPHPLAFLRSLRRADQLRRSWYMGLFQLPGVAERAVAHDDYALIDALWRTWSPGFALAPQAMAQLKACLAASMPAPLGYYRAMVRPVAAAAARVRRAAADRVPVPTLHLQGADDGCIDVDAGAGQEAKFSGPFETRILADAGHFLANERPDEVASAVLEWLTRHAPARTRSREPS